MFVFEIGQIEYTSRILTQNRYNKTKHTHRKNRQTTAQCSGNQKIIRPIDKYQFTLVM